MDREQNQSWFIRSRARRRMSEVVAVMLSIDVRAILRVIVETLTGLKKIGTAELARLRRLMTKEEPARPPRRPRPRPRPATGRRGTLSNLLARRRALPGTANQARF
jgi:hypothetical protein